MCGLCGEIRFDAGQVDPHALGAMRDQLLHRGPDAAGTYISPTGHAGLGFRRLKILDLSDAANQPLPNETGTVHVTFNGEIYNFTSLRTDLIARGHRFRSSTDSEVIVHLYEEVGDRFADYIDGMFAVALWDERHEQIVLARDRAGKKPLFYWHSESRALFASEIKAFFVRRDDELEIDPEQIPYFFLYGYVPCPHTFYKGVRQVEPGTVVTVRRDGSVSTRRFWSLQYPTATTTSADLDRSENAEPRLRTLMTSAVERRLVADVPLGAFLSGGLDSTIVVGLMSRLMTRRVQTFSIGFKNTRAYDETAYARLVAQKFNTDHTEFLVEAGSFDLIEKLLWHHDGPFGDASAVPTFIVSELTRRQVTVVLTGDGGDEVFGGYDRFNAALAAERLPPAARLALRTAADLLPTGKNSRGLWARIHRFAGAATLSLDHRLTRWAGLFDEGVEDLLDPGLRSVSEPIDRLRYLRRFEHQLAGRSMVNRILGINFNTYLLDDLLVKTDRCTMAHSLEARSPFLDTELMQYVASLADSCKFDGRRTKIILRDAFRDLVPSEIRLRSKMGFGIPFGEWFRGPLRSAVRDLLMAKNPRYTEYLSQPYVHQLVNRHESGQADLGLQIWALLCFETWLKSLPRWIKQAPMAAPSLA